MVMRKLMKQKGNKYCNSRDNTDDRRKKEKNRNNTSNTDKDKQEAEMLT